MDRKTNFDFSKLTGPQIEAIELKFQGMTYAEISQYLMKQGHEVPVQTLKNWFWKNGTLYEIYTDYASDQFQERYETSKDILKAHVVTASKVFIDGLEHSNPYIRLASAREIIRRALGDYTVPEKSQNQESAVARIIKKYDLDDLKSRV